MMMTSQGSIMPSPNVLSMNALRRQIHSRRPVRELGFWWGKAMVGRRTEGCFGGRGGRVARKRPERGLK